MTTIDNSIEEREQWIRSQIRKMNTGERNEFISEARFFYLHINEYSQGEIFRSFRKEKDDNYATF